MFGVTGSVQYVGSGYFPSGTLIQTYNWSNMFGFRHWQGLEIRMSGHKVTTPVHKSHFKVCPLHCEVGYLRLNDRDGGSVSESKVALGGGFIDAIWFIQKWQI